MPAAEPVASRPLILVVDDAHTLRLVMSRSLMDGGYDVLAAPDGQSATVLIQGLRSPPDLVITDVRMPTMGGVQLAAWVSEHYPHLPVMFVSGFPAEENVSGPLLTKPFTPAELIAAVRLVLGKSRGSMAT